MSQLFVPPRVARDLALETQRREAAAMGGLAVEQGWDWVQRFNHELDRIEPGLRLVFCPDPAPLDAVACGARPGRWHVYRPGTNGPMSLLPIVGPNDEFMEPTSAVFDMLRREDWWDERVVEDRRRRERRLEEAKLARVERERREFDEEMYERWQAVSRAQVSMNTSTPWAQNASGAKRRGKKAS